MSRVSRAIRRNFSGLSEPMVRMFVQPIGPSFLTVDAKISRHCQVICTRFSACASARVKADVREF